MKSRKKTSKRGGAANFINEDSSSFTKQEASFDFLGKFDSTISDLSSPRVTYRDDEAIVKNLTNDIKEKKANIRGGDKRKSRKSRKAKKTKKGRGVHEGGKKKCPKHCHRHTRHTRKGFKHGKN